MMEMRCSARERDVVNARRIHSRMCSEGVTHQKMTQGKDMSNPEMAPASPSQFGPINYPGFVDY
jgi:hypothetical protein